MNRRFPFALKLGLSFIIVILVSVALVYFLTARALTADFAEFREQSKKDLARQICCLLAEYRMITGSWVGVDRLLSTQYSVIVEGQLVVRRTSLVGGSFSLANETGRVFISTEQDRVGTVLSEQEIVDGIPIESDGSRLGTLLLGGIGSVLDPAEEEFLGSVSQSALIGGGIASGIAFLLSALLITQVLSPLRLLSRATERIAHGDLPQRVTLKARDEFGRLGESFNRMIDNLRRSETIRQTMTADIAHELRTPVTIIQGSLEAILDGVYQPTTETIAPIYEEILHLGGLIDDLRDLALAEAGELRLDKEPTDLVALVEQVTETVRASVEQVPTLYVEADSALLKLSVDPKRIHQVLSNLLSNALRVTPRDGEIRVELSRQGEEVELRVSDSGPGIAAEDLPHLFERFYRGDRARSRSAGGSGLGLAIARQWVEAHGGRIWVENRETGGARFVVRLPVA
ncbi:MAG TPA: ATP-binding protein [Candidatus Heimdallarchaeota archaeon]|nr:ATP-binding protein [Candidatus Heimdallarchaeota archaeon]